MLARRFDAAVGVAAHHHWDFAQFPTVIVREGPGPGGVYSFLTGIGASNQFAARFHGGSPPGFSLWGQSAKGPGLVNGSSP